MKRMLRASRALDELKFLDAVISDTTYEVYNNYADDAELEYRDFARIIKEHIDDVPFEDSRGNEYIFQFGKDFDYNDIYVAMDKLEYDWDRGKG